MELVDLMGVVGYVLVLLAQLAWMASACVNLNAMVKIVVMMGVVVRVDLVLPIINVLVVSVCVFRLVLMGLVGLMVVGVYVLVRILNIAVMAGVLTLLGVRV
jgi:hypothetical protein